jgi:CHAT domain-containing protein
MSETRKEIVEKVDAAFAQNEMVNSLFGDGKSAEALSFAERAKARVLLDVLRSGRTRISGSISREEQAEESRLYVELVSINALLRAERAAEQSGASRIAELEVKLKEARSAYEAFQTTLYAGHPELKLKQGVLPEFTIQRAGELLSDAGTAILEYIVTDEQTLLFVLTKNSTSPSNVTLKSYQIKLKRGDLSALVETFRSRLSTNHPGFRQIGMELYDLLIKPAESYIRNSSSICIVPDGALWNLPFQALQTRNDKYLLELYAIYYAPSIQVLHEMRRKAIRLRSSLWERSNGRATLSCWLSQTRQ